MVDFDFYTGCYLGSRIPQKAFSAAAQRAQEYLQHLERVCRVVSAGEDCRKMALCAMAEKIYEAHRRSGVRSAEAGDLRMTYDDRQPPLSAQLLQCAGIYLDIYRGVDGWSS